MRTGAQYKAICCPARLREKVSRLMGDNPSLTFGPNPRRVAHHPIRTDLFDNGHPISPSKIRLVSRAFRDAMRTLRAKK